MDITFLSCDFLFSHTVNSDHFSCTLIYSLHLLLKMTTENKLTASFLLSQFPMILGGEKRPQPRPLPPSPSFIDLQSQILSLSLTHSYTHTHTPLTQSNIITQFSVLYITLHLSSSDSNAY